MRVSSVELFHVRIPFKGSFKHALKERREADAVLVAIHDDRGRTGWGEIVPREYLTGETIESVYSDLAPSRARAIFEESFSAFEDVAAHLERSLVGAGRALATNCGFELALIEVFGQPAARYLGADVFGPELPAGVVIGFEVATADLPKHCALLRMTGKKHIKVKVGAEDDLDRLAVVAKAFGAMYPLRLDANAAWSTAEAIEKLTAMKRAATIASIEQPLPARDFAGLRELRETTKIPVMADESLCTLEDGQRLIDERAADIFNIRLGKCGGFLGAKKLVDLAREHRLGCHLGALVGETGILSAAAELFGRAVPVFDCLEGKGQNKFLLAEDVVGAIGLVDRARVEKYLVASQNFSGGNQ